MRSLLKTVRSGSLFILFLTIIIIFPRGIVRADKNTALELAQIYIEAMPFSRSALIEQLEFAGNNLEDAEYAVDNLGADWMEMAVLSAESYLKSSDYSENGLMRQLESDGFTHEEAEHGVSIAAKDVDWDEMAARRAAFYLRSSAFSKNGLIRQLESERVGFTHEQAVYGAEAAGENVDWKEMAVKRAEKFVENSIMSENALIRQLESESVGFTHEEALYAVAEVGKNIDWFANAVEKAKSYLQVVSVSRSELIQYLESDAEGFTHEQAVYGADNSGASWGDMITVLADNLDNLFPLHGIEEEFTPAQQALYSDIGPGTAIQTTNQYGERIITLFSNPDSIHDRNHTIRINSGHLDNFMLSVDVKLNDVFPAGKSGCYVGYINDMATAKKTEEFTEVYLMADGMGVGFYRKPASSDSGTFTRILDQARPQYHLSLIRFTGQTYAFIDGTYAGQFTDSNAGPFQLVYGVSAMKDGDTAGCSFDNLSVRKVNN